MSLSVLVALVSLPLSAYASDKKCEDQLVAPVAASATIVNDIESKPRFTIDTPTISIGFRRFLQQLKPLQPSIQQLSKLEQELSLSQRPITDIQNEAAELANRLNQEARDLLQISNPTTEQRRLLEGYRLLLRRYVALDRRAEYFKSPEGQEERQESQEQEQEQNQEQKKEENSQSQSDSSDTTNDATSDSSDGSPTAGTADPTQQPGSEPSESQTPAQNTEQNTTQTIVQNSDDSTAPQRQASDESTTLSVTQEDLLPQNSSPQDSSTRSSTPPHSLSDEQLSRLLQKLISTLWAQTLRRMERSDDLLNGIVDFQRLCQSFQSRYPNYKFLRKYILISQSVFETLDATNVQYANLENKINQITFQPGDTSTVKSLLVYINVIFSTLQQEVQLTTEENALHLKVKELLGKYSVNPGNQVPVTMDLIRSLWRMLVGPLSKGALKTAYSGNDIYGLNIAQLLEALQEGKLTDLLVMSRLKSMLRITRYETKQKLTTLRPTGERIAIAESDHTLTIANDLANPLRIHRDGPPAQDLARLATEELLERTYRDNIETNRSPRVTKPKIVDIILYDVSGSMQLQNKGVLQNHIIAAYLDESQIKVAQNRAIHKLYLVPFNDQPLYEETVVGIQNAQKYFNRMRVAPHEGSGGTNINAALIRALELIKAAQSEAAQSRRLADFRRANIVLMTDGDAPVNLNAILAKRTEISSSIQISINVITTGGGNPSLHSLNTDTQTKAKIGHYSYQNIPTAEINKILDPNERLATLTMTAQTLSTESIAAQLTTADLVPLRRAATLLFSKLRTDVNLKSSVLIDVNQYSGLYNSQYAGQYADLYRALLSPLQTALDSNLTMRWSNHQRQALQISYIELVAKELNISAKSLLILK